MTIQCSPGLSASWVLQTNAVGQAPTILVGSSSLATTPRTTSLVRESSANTLFDYCPSVVEYDVSVLVDFQHRLEFAVRNNIHRLGECRCEVNFDTQVTLLHQVETRPVAGVWCQIKSEEGVAVAGV